MSSFKSNIINIFNKKTIKYDDEIKYNAVFMEYIIKAHLMGNLIIFLKCKYKAANINDLLIKLNTNKYFKIYSILIIYCINILVKDVINFQLHKDFNYKSFFYYFANFYRLSYEDYYKYIYLSPSQKKLKDNSLKYTLSFKSENNNNNCHIDILNNIVESSNSLKF